MATTSRSSSWRDEVLSEYSQTTRSKHWLESSKYPEQDKYIDRICCWYLIWEGTDPRNFSNTWNRRKPIYCVNNPPPITINLEQVQVGPKKENFSMFECKLVKPWIANFKEANFRCTWLRGNVLLIHSRSGLRITNMPAPWIDGDKTCRSRVSQELVANCT